MYKSILVLSFLFMTLSSKSQVNTYFNNDPVWKVTSFLWGQGCMNLSVINYFIDGDTIINSLIYKKIYREGMVYIYTNSMPMPWCPVDTLYYLDSVPAYFLRSNQKLMYILLPNNTIEYLLYDFNLNIGDTLPTTYNNHVLNLNIVSNIDSIITPNGYYKIFDLSTGKKLMEGIGSSFGLVEPVVQFIEDGNELNCFSLNNISYFPSSGLNCQVVVGIDKIENDFTFSVFPNPFSDKLIINKKINNKLIFKIYNSEGKLVEENYLNSGTEEIKLKVDLSPGFYFYSVTDEKGKIKSGKLIKN